jgi:excisionase family DNA binding protein
MKRRPKLLTLEQASAKLNVSSETLEQLVADGRIRPATTWRAIRKRKGSKHFLFREKDLLCFAAESKRD